MDNLQNAQQTQVDLSSIELPPSAPNEPSQGPSMPSTSAACSKTDECKDANNNGVNAPKFGTLVPNRVFVGGLESSANDADLLSLFSVYGEVKTAKVIVDRAGVSKGYGFVTFTKDEEAKTLMKFADNVYLRHRKLTVAPAIKKQPFGNYGEPASPSPAPLYNGGNALYQNNAFPMPSNQPVYSMPPPYDPMLGQYLYQAAPYAPQQHFTYNVHMPSPQVQALTGCPLIYYGGAQGPTAPFLEPTSAWIDPGISTQYPVAPSLPYLVPMY